MTFAYTLDAIMRYVQLCAEHIVIAFVFTRESPLSQSAGCRLPEGFSLPVASHVLHKTRDSVSLNTLCLFDEGFDLFIRQKDTSSESTQCHPRFAVSPLTCY